MSQPADLVEIADERYIAAPERHGLELVLEAFDAGLCGVFRHRKAGQEGAHRGNLRDEFLLVVKERIKAGDVRDQATETRTS